MRPLVYVVGVMIFFVLTSTSHAQSPGKIDLDAAEAAMALIGAPAVARDDIEIGKVADIEFDDVGRVAGVSIDAPVPLGLGPSRIELPRGAFKMMAASVRVDLPADVI